MACRLLGECRFGRPIYREHLDMVGPFEGRPNFSGAKQFVYVRYDPDLSQPGLDALGLADIKAINVQTVDSIEHIADIQKVGEAFARKHLNVAEHLRGSCRACRLHHDRHESCRTWLRVRGAGDAV